jgi:hypothetical protein
MLLDVVQQEGIPSLATGSRGYINSLKAVERLDVKLLVPSRGTLAQGKRAIRRVSRTITTTCTTCAAGS